MQIDGKDGPKDGWYPLSPPFLSLTHSSLPPCSLVEFMAEPQHFK